MGVIDALGDGFRIVFRRPLLIAIPVLLDAVIVLTPSISVSSIYRNALGPDSPAAELSGALGLNLSALLTLYVPSLAASAARDAAPAAVQIGSPTAAIGTGALLAILGVIIGAVYLSLIARAVRTGSESEERSARPKALDGPTQEWGNPEPRSTDLLPTVAQKTPSLLVLALPAVGLTMVALLLPVILLSGQEGAIPSSPIPAGLSAILMLATMVALPAAVAAAVVLYFAIVALMLEPVRVRESLAMSFGLLRARPRSAFVFVALATAIQIGLGRIFLQIALSSPGLMLAILANAFIGAGITAASMLFFLGPSPDEGIAKRRPGRNGQEG